jgi:phage anti-repressor protein
MSLYNAEEIKDISEIKNPYIKKAFECSINNITGMPLKEFVKVLDYPIDPFMVDNFFTNLNDDIPVYVTNELIEWCGFNGKEFKRRKDLFNEILKNFEKEKDYWTYSNKEYEEYYENSMSEISDIENTAVFPNPSEFRGKNKTKHLVLSVDCFKQVMMMLNTPKAKDIRLYYLALEKLIKIYAKYQYYQQIFKNQILEIADREHRECIKRLDKSNFRLEESNKRLEAILTEMKQEQEVQTEVLDEVVDKLDKATDERAPRTRSASKQGQFLLIELNSQVSPWQYYVIRAQKGSIKQTYTKLIEKYPNCEIKLKINYQPNAVNLFNLIKEELRNVRKVIRVSSNYIKLASDYTKEQFIEDVKKINAEKKDL